MGALTSGIKTKFMNLDLPVPGVTKGPTWAQMVDTVFKKIDEHDHTPGNGAPLTLNNFDISSNIDMVAYGIDNCGFLQLSQGPGIPDRDYTLFNYRGDLWWQYQTTGYGTGSFCQITSGDQVFSRSCSFEPLYISSVTSPYIISALEKVSAVFVDTSTGAVTINLADTTNYNEGRYFLIQDMTGNANTNNITITPTATDNIGVAVTGANYVITTDYGYVWIVSYAYQTRWAILTSA